VQIYLTKYNQLVFEEKCQLRGVGGLEKGVGT